MEELLGKSTITNDDARLDITANSFWGGRFERTFMDFRVLTLLYPTTRIPPLKSASGSTSW